MNIFYRIICIIAIFFLQSCVHHSNVRQDINYVNNWKKSPTINILPAQVSASVYIAGRGTVRIKETEQKIKNYLANNLPEIMRQKGYVIDNTLIWEKDPDVLKISSSYKKLLDQLYPKNTNPEENVTYLTKLSVGRNVIKGLSNKTPANLIMTINYSGNHSISARFAEQYNVDTLFKTNQVIYRPRGYVNNTTGTLDIALLERSSGKLFWANRIDTNYDFLSCLVTDASCDDKGLGLDMLPNKN